MKKALAIALISALLFSVITITLRVKLAHANPIVVPITDISLDYPQNRTYSQNFIQVRFSYSIPDEPGKDHEGMKTSVSYILDGLESESFNGYKFVSNKLQDGTSYSVSFQVKDLSNGSNTLFVHVSATADSGFTTFSADSETVTFTTKTLSSNPTPTPTYTPEPTLTPEIIPTPYDEPTLFSASIVPASVASVTLVGVGLLVYFRKRKR